MHSLCVFLGHVLTINRVELNTVPNGGDQRPIPWTVKVHIRTAHGAKFLSFELFLMTLPNMSLNLVLNFRTRALTS